MRLYLSDHKMLSDLFCTLDQSSIYKGKLRRMQPMELEQDGRIWRNVISCYVPTIGGNLSFLFQSFNIFL